MDKIPHSMESEQSVLGALMIDSRLWHETCEIVQASHFYVAHHREIFKAMHGLANSGQPLDPITLHEHLQQSGSEIDFGYIANLTDTTPSTVNTLAYAEIVREKAIMRETIKASNNIIDMMSNPSGKNIIELSSEAQAMIDSATQGSDRGEGRPASINDAIRETVLHMEKVQSIKGLPGLTTGLIDCDRRTMGFQVGDLHVIGAAPSMGKTARMLNIFEANLDIPNLIFSLEMPKIQLVQRMASSMANVDYSEIRSARVVKGEDSAKVYAQFKILQQKPLWIDDQGGLTFEQICARARRFKRENPSMGIIGIDYLQLIRLPTSDVNYETAKIITGLKALGKELECVVIILSQLNRTNAGKRPHMNDLRNSGEIEAAADSICMIFREEVYDEHNPDIRGEAELIWRKVRAGEIGTDYVAFDGAHQKFKNRIDDIPNY